MGAAVEVESQALLDTCLADVFVVSTKERFVRPVGSLNRAKRSPGLRYTAVSYQPAPVYPHGPAEDRCQAGH